jgi:hypothetical protein
MFLLKLSNFALCRSERLSCELNDQLHYAKISAMYLYLTLSEGGHESISKPVREVRTKMA